MGKTYLALILLAAVVMVSGCTQGNNTQAPESREPPAPIPKGILVSEIPRSADVIFNSIAYVLQDPACLDGNYDLKINFITDAACNGKIYYEGRLAAKMQLYYMGLGAGEPVQITNTDCFFVNGQVADSRTLMVNAMCSDTDGNGRINDQDDNDLYLLDLGSGKMDCLTCGFALDAINNPDYSKAMGRVVFSAQKDGSFHNYLFTIGADKDLVQLTHDEEYMDFDCSWSEDGTKIVFNRISGQPPFTDPAKVWLMDSDGSNMEKITNGGDNPDNEGLFGPYPIGLDADPDLSPDNSQIVFSRLKSGEKNMLFGVFELVVIDLDTGQEEVLDSIYANMIPEWKSRGIVFVRQASTPDYMHNPMDIKQTLYTYKDGIFREILGYPYNVFPISANSVSWVES